MAVSQKEFIAWFEELYEKDAIYLWGANGETITKELVDKLYGWYGSSTYNRTYYNSKLAEGKGKIGADCSGAFLKLSGVDRTASGYYSTCKKKGLIASLPTDMVCLVFNKNLTHIGAYLGNGYTIEMKNSQVNVHKEKLKRSRWYYYGIPSFVDYSVPLEKIETSISSCDKIVSNYQKWLNDNLGGKNIAVDGAYGPDTKRQTVRMIQTIFNKYYGKNIEVDGAYGPDTKEACPKWSVLKANAEAFALITYIIHVYLYAVAKYDMQGIVNSTKVSTVYSDNTKSYVAKYQSNTRGLVVDGWGGSATLYQMFK